MKGLSLLGDSPHAVNPANIGRAEVATTLEQKFDRIMREHGPALSRLAASYEPIPSQREDLLQEIVLAIWQALRHFRGECSERNSGSTGHQRKQCRRTFEPGKKSAQAGAGSCIVINEDRELELWKEEWRAETGPFPELKKRVSQRTLRMIAVNVAVLGMLVWYLVFPARIAMHDPSQENIVSAAGECFLALLASAFVVWSQIGVWRPEAQNTRAYAELLYKRALSDVQAVRFASYLFWTAAFVVACTEWIFMPKWPVVRAHPAQHLARLGFDLLLFLGMWMFLIWNKRRKLKQLEEAKSFLEELECHG